MARHGGSGGGRIGTTFGRGSFAFGARAQHLIEAVDHPTTVVGDLSPAAMFVGQGRLFDWATEKPTKSEQRASARAARVAGSDQQSRARLDIVIADHRTR